MHAAECSLNACSLLPGAICCKRREHSLEILSRRICPYFKPRVIVGGRNRHLLCSPSEVSFASCSHPGTSEGPRTGLQGYRLKLATSLSQGVPGDAGMGREWMKLACDWGPPWRGIEATTSPPHPPPRPRHQMLASPKGAQSLGFPEVVKIPNPCHGVCLLCEVCCCYI